MDGDQMLGVTQGLMSQLIKEDTFLPSALLGETFPSSYDFPRGHRPPLTKHICDKNKCPDV